jgi:hypothetical protein
MAGRPAVYCDRLAYLNGKIGCLPDGWASASQLHSHGPCTIARNAVAAVEAVNMAPEYLIGRKLIAEGAKVATERLADMLIPIKNVI